MIWLAPLFALCAQLASAQDSDLRATGGLGTVTLTDDVYTLTLTSETEWFDAAMATNIVNTFFTVYPQECETFNSNCEKEVTIRIAPTEVPCGPSAARACTTGSEIALAGDVLWYEVEDYDMVTHEAMHVVQWGYVNPDACGYWVEGIADVARSRFGLNNAAASWALGYEPGKTYADGYTNAAHFLEWVKETYQYDVAVNLDAALRSIGCPDDLFWQKQTTLSLAELWDAYVSVFDPSQDEEPSEEPIDPAPAPVVGEPLGPDQGGQPIELDNVETL